MIRIISHHQMLLHNCLVSCSDIWNVSGLTYTAYETSRKNAKISHKNYEIL